ncbi:hypothetical protein IKN40_07975 [bacterium]|nr:hypothetical protein [bacterium]
MKQLNNFIIEKLKINSKSKVNVKDPDTWTINDAEDGDIVSWNGDTLLFIYKCLNSGDNKINSTPDDTIVFHASWICDSRNILDIGIDTGVGDTSKPNLFKLASKEMCEKFYKELENRGYKWDNMRKEIIKL